MTDCWVCHQSLTMNADTCWPVEAKNPNDFSQGQPYVPNFPTYHDCIVRAIGHRGPGGNNIIFGYQKGAQRPSGAGLILRQ